MNNVLGINYSYSDRENLRELTKIRALASLPIVGKYRIIDFVLSGYVNSEIYDISIITKSNYHSLVDHLGSGKEWDLTRKRGGLRILSPMSMLTGTPEPDVVYRGTLDALSRHMGSIKRSMAEYVIMTGSSVTCCEIDYKELLRVHVESGADITAVYTKSMNGGTTVPAGAALFDLDENEKLCGLRFSSDDATEQQEAWSVGTFVIKKSLLETLVADSISSQRYSLHTDILQRLCNTLCIRGYEYKGLLFEISSVTGYMQANMNFLKQCFREKAFARPIFTKVKDSVPVTYVKGCSVKHSIVADGCVIEGTVENSVISRGVRIGKGSVIKNSIVMQNTEIMRNVTLEHVILDKDVIVRDGRRITGHETYPVVIEKTSIV